ncbi:MAG: HAMP domain-containing protein [Balneolaceae bacterium]|nr:HAMP domain-containing protein [Balneolaceae bacterium]
MRPSITKRTWTLTILISCVAVIYGVFEISVSLSEISEQERQNLTTHALESASKAFSVFGHTSTQQSRNLAALIENEIKSASNKKKLYNHITDNFDFWGVSVFKNRELWLWSGFGEHEYPDDVINTTQRQQVFIKRDNNVTYISSLIPIFVEQDNQLFRYDVYTKKKIRQENLLTIGESKETQPANYLDLELQYPVHFNFINSLPENIEARRTLSIQGIDSAGVVYTLSEDYPAYQANRENRYFILRAAFYVLLMVLSLLFLISLARELTAWSSLLLKLFAILIVWVFFANIEYGVSWLELFPLFKKENLDILNALLYYCIDSLFFFLLTLSIFSSTNYGILKIKRRISRLTPNLYLGFGFLSALLLSYYFCETYLLFEDSHLAGMNLDILPNLPVSVFYISSGLFAFSIISLLCLIGWFLLRSGIQPLRMRLLRIIAGFTAGIIVIYVLNIYPHASFWLVYSTGIFFAFILLFCYLLFRNPFTIKYSSRLRLLLLFSIITVAVTYIPVYNGYQQQLDELMLEAAHSFIEEEAPQAELIARNLLADLHQQLSIITEGDIEERSGFLESYFIQKNQDLIDPKWESYSISTLLIDTTGRQIAEYSSDLNPPNWMNNFLIQSLKISFEQERIRPSNLRPVIRERPLNEPSSQYSSFRRGWIPLYKSDNTEKIIGWILGSVYKYRPQYDKPLRAVVAANNNSSWDRPINITEFIEGTSNRSSVLGIPLELPGYFQLSDSLITKVQQDSIVFRNRKQENQLIREFFVATGKNRVVRVATNSIEIEEHIFAVLRYFFYLVLVGLILLTSLSWKQEMNILGHNRRFRDRLIDRFILASLLCLMALSVTSYFAINNQNKESVRDTLLSKVQNLAEALTEKGEQPDGESIKSLYDLTSTLDADATLYKDQKVSLSTSTQIYSQHILPNALPWSVYEAIYLDNNIQHISTIKLGTQELLIGYQPWFNREGEIAGVAAIPTFLKAPKFNKQLLATTSYLLGIYVLIFGLFIIGASFISTQLTHPLNSIRQGLKKISGGNLQTKLPVKSNDEIGSLSNAYNVMVERLKELQKELAVAEREAAWKEMAQQVAHEIKNPLTPMKLNLQHLERQLQDSDSDPEVIKAKVKKITANMIEQIESLNHIASDFSKFAQPIDEEFEQININTLLNSVASLYEPEENVTITSELYKQQLSVDGIKEELRRVLVNLMKNAYEAMPDGGTITLRSSLNSNKQLILIEVRDTGKGIANKNREDIFVPNFSTKSSGTGLGLAISKKIIEEHSGTISFESEPGKGTTFRIKLPVSQPD